MAVIEVQDVVKKFGDYAAVNHVSFDVEPGRIFGLLGPNGAGKTTTIRMLTNIYIPDEGVVKVLGETAGPKQQEQIGYLPEERGLYKKIKVMEQIAYFGQLKGMDRNDAIATGKKWLRDLDAGDWENKKIQELSKGMQQKIQFITTILHDPEVIILDEPFSGFDPVNVELLKKVISDMRDRGKTIILSTHVMEQVEQMCDDICLINKGKVMLSGKVRDIKKGYGRDTVLLEFDGDDSFLDELKNINIINKSKNRIEFRFGDSPHDAKEILKKALETTDIYRYELSEPSLNEIFIDVVSRKEENDG